MKHQLRGFRHEALVEFTIEDYGITKDGMTTVIRIGPILMRSVVPAGVPSEVRMAADKQYLVDHGFDVSTVELWSDDGWAPLWPKRGG